MKSAKVSIIRCKDYNSQNVHKAVNEAVGILGGIERFVKPGEKVLIKPNLLSARMPEDGVCTHPEVVRAMIKLVSQVTDNVSVGDSPGGFDVIDLDKLYEVTGIRDVCRQEGVRLVKFDSAENTNGLPLARAVKEADIIINLPKMKTHDLTTLTGAVKNMFGAVVGKYKAECHFRHSDPKDFCSLLVEIFSYVRPCLSIMDGIVAMEGDGPSAGRLRKAGLIIASPDAVALDVVFAQLVGLKPDEILTTVYADSRGLGTGRLEDIEVLGEPLEKARINDFILPQTSFIYKAPKWIIKIFGNLIRSYPVIYRSACIKCRICEKNCPAFAITIDRYHIDYSKCVFCFCCHELCPHSAVGVRKTFMGKSLSLALKVRHLWKSRK